MPTDAATQNVANPPPRQTIPGLQVLFRVEEVAMMFSCSRRTIYEFITAKVLKTYKVGADMRITRASIEDLLNNNWNHRAKSKRNR